MRVSTLCQRMLRRYQPAITVILTCCFATTPGPTIAAHAESSPPPPTVLSTRDRLDAKQASAGRLLLIAQEILRRSQHDRSSADKPTSLETHEQFLLDVVGLRLRSLRAEITSLEKNLASSNELGSSKTPDIAVDARQATIEKLVDDFEYLKPKHRNDVKMFAWPLAGKILSTPGSALRSGGAKWPGIFIRSKPGSQVHAISAGNVAYAGEMKHLGLLVILDHEDGHLSLYGHNGEILVETNQRIKENQVIAVVDSGVNAENSGLYFEIRRDGKPIDPRQVCSFQPGGVSENDGN